MGTRLQTDPAAETRLPGQRPADMAWASLAILVPAIVALVSSMGSIDLAYHVRAGEEILGTGSLPRVDTYTFSVPGAPWIDQQWGSQVVLAALFRAGGWATLAAAQALFVSVTFFLIFLACRERGASYRASTALTLAGFVVASPTLAMRPQLIALPLFAAAIWVLAARRRRPRLLWLFPVLAAVCANLHGSFTLFPLLVGLAWVEDRMDRDPGAGRTLVVVALSFLATLANPFGLDAWRYAYELSTNPIIRDTITEWAPVSVEDMSGVFTIASAAAVAVFFARRTTRARWADLLTLGVFLGLALSASRAIVWWAMIAPVVLAAHFADAPSSEPRGAAGQRESRVPAVVMVAVLLMAVVVLLPWWRGSSYETHLAEAPPGLTRAIETLPAGSHVWVHQPWGSWVEFAVPEVLVFVDSRIELIPEDVWTDYGQVAFSGARWREALERWSPDAIVADAEEWDLIPVLREDPAWRVEYEDEDGILFTRA